jgi:nucleoid-associated protein YgaU
MEKVRIRNLETGEELKCLFNPSEYTIAKSISWDPKQQAGKDVGQVEFTGGSPRTLSVELFFDVFEEQGDVRTHIKKLWKLAMVDETNRNQKTRRSRPPICLFEWGSDWSFRASVTSLSVRYTLFEANGTPVRATASLQLQETEDEADKPGQNPTSFAEPGIRTREIRPHDSLPWIAYEEYGDANQWRRIAEANGILDPMALSPGDLLSIPRI